MSKLENCSFEDGKFRVNGAKSIYNTVGHMLCHIVDLENPCRFEMEVSYDENEIDNPDGFFETFGEDPMGPNGEAVTRCAGYTSSGESLNFYFDVGFFPDDIDCMSEDKVYFKITLK